MRDQNKSELFQVPAVIQKVETTVDKGIKLVVYTSQEVEGKRAASLFSLKGKLGWFLFKETEMRQEDALNLPPVKTEHGDKTPSQRLRAVLYLHWKSDGSQGSSDLYYNEMMEEIIQFYKDKLPK